MLHMLLEGGKVTQQWWIKWGKQLKIAQGPHCFLGSRLNRLSCCCEKHLTQRNGFSHTGREKRRCQATGSIKGCPLPLKPESLSSREVDHPFLIRLNGDEPGDDAIRAGVCYPGKFHDFPPACYYTIFSTVSSSRWPVDCLSAERRLRPISVSR